MTIDPKPTVYRGIRFASRLEARWAVFLDHHFLVNEWHYEPRKFTLPESGWTYTPDFLFSVGPYAALIEVKPKEASAEYLEDLSQFSPKLGLPLFLCEGSFYKTVPIMRNLVNPNERFRVDRNPWLPSAEEAIKAAKMFRFDLPHQLPPHKRGKTDSLRQFLSQFNPNRKKGKRQ